jgi:hypothetical protein
MATTDPSAPGGAVRERRQVFLEAGVLLVDEPSDDRRQETRRVLASGSVDAVTLLAEAHDVSVIAGGTDTAVMEGLPSVDWIDGLPAAFRPGAWYLTTDDTWCEGDRPAGLQSILVGPRRPPAHRPTARCDLEARDLNAAVMEILVRETMA